VIHFSIKNFKGFAKLYVGILECIMKANGARLPLITILKKPINTYVFYSFNFNFQNVVELYVKVF